MEFCIAFYLYKKGNDRRLFRYDFLKNICGYIVKKIIIFFPLRLFHRRDMLI